MLTNATLTRVDRRTGANALGEEIHTTGSVISVEVFSDNATSGEKWNLGATIKDAKRAVYIEKSLWTAAGLTTPPAAGDRLAVTVETGETYTMQTLDLTDFVLGYISHWVVFLKPF